MVIGLFSSRRGGGGGDVDLSARLLGMGCQVRAVVVGREERWGLVRHRFLLFLPIGPGEGGGLMGGGWIWGDWSAWRS
jgi:hypothetical protein